MAMRMKCAWEEPFVDGGCYALKYAIDHASKLSKAGTFIPSSIHRSTRSATHLAGERCSAASAAAYIDLGSHDDFV